MDVALSAAADAAARGDVPVGAVVVFEGRIIARASNRREADGDPTAHAEMLAMRASTSAVGQGWRLDGTTLYVTQEPCPMCAGAIVNARVSRLVYGCRNPKAGAVRSLFQLVDDPRLNHRVEVAEGVRASECAAALTQFFARLRAAGEK
jgi:tRNA(adenine34) deaminase